MTLLSSTIKDPAIAVLGIFSLISWWIIVDRLIALRKAREPKNGRSETLHEPNTPFSRIRAETRARNSLLSSSELMTMIDALVRREKRGLEKRLALLSAIGSTSPYIGLLGTVFGIIDAFKAIEIHNDMTPAVVSGGISSALIATAAGLVVAIPAVFAHNLILAAVRRQAEQWEEIIALEFLSEDDSQTYRLRKR